jgi:hypothetical protein
MESASKIERPFIIHFMCFLGFLRIFVFFVSIIYSLVAGSKEWISIYSILYSIAFLACFIGIFKMKKIWAFAYIGLFVVTQSKLLLYNQWSIVSLVLPILTITALLYYLNEMD